MRVRFAVLATLVLLGLSRVFSGQGGLFLGYDQ